MSLLHVLILVFSYDLSFFFFKQKTAYEMRISDWSSDVCSSDLSPSRWPAYWRTGTNLRQGRQTHRQVGPLRPPKIPAGLKPMQLQFFPSKPMALYLAWLFLVRSLAVLALLVIVLKTLDLQGESGKILAQPGIGDEEFWRLLALRVPPLIARFFPFLVLLD